MQFNASVRNRVAGIEDCPYCSGKRAVPGKTSLKALYPDLANEYDNSNLVDTDYILPTYTQKVKWNCPKCGMYYEATVNGRVNGIENCPYCSGKKAIPGKTSFKALHPELMTEWRPTNILIANPDHITVNCTIRVWWECSVCGYRYKMSPKERLYYQKRKKKACYYCKGLRQKRTHFF